MIARVGGGVAKMGEGGQKKLPKISSEDLMYSKVTIVIHTILHLKAANKVDLKSSHHQEKYV